MGLPRPTEALVYYRVAQLRFDDSQLLLEANRTNGAVYLGGYAIECVLKALILDNVSEGLRHQLVKKFRGGGAHNIEWLGSLYRQHARAAVPRDVTRNLSQVTEWSTDLRYEAKLMERRRADEFMVSVVAVFKWANGRM